MGPRLPWLAPYGDSAMTVRCRGCGALPDGQPGRTYEAALAPPKPNPAFVAHPTGQTGNLHLNSDMREP
ncbi:hypothetical protein GCM10011578_021030 [Streptomyces fuscichromogenes]|uniref:Uncharacterized protein n=1 Tax=Streptomyces fuscichromogenes TaxID=1324013 RepID=A0A917XA14_9ACTN|nr:hypothetical protein GCM10011578_021030 [Streptomyces fuscichromogenes]